jgi:hypothetical protein
MMSLHNIIRQMGFSMFLFLIRFSYLGKAFKRFIMAGSPEMVCTFSFFFLFLGRPFALYGKTGMERRRHRRPVPQKKEKEEETKNNRTEKALFFFSQRSERIHLSVLLLLFLLIFPFYFHFDFVLAHPPFLITTCWCSVLLPGNHTNTGFLLHHHRITHTHAQHHALRRSNCVLVCFPLAHDTKYPPKFSR